MMTIGLSSVQLIKNIELKKEIILVECFCYSVSQKWSQSFRDVGCSHVCNGGPREYVKARNKFPLTVLVILENSLENNERFSEQKKSKSLQKNPKMS